MGQKQSEDAEPAYGELEKEIRKNTNELEEFVTQELGLGTPREIKTVLDSLWSRVEQEVQKQQRRKQEREEKGLDLDSNPDYFG